MKNMSNKTIVAALDQVDAGINTEVDAAALSFAELIERHGVPARIGYGSVVEGTILPFSSGGYHFVDIGQKADAMLPKDDAPHLQPGDTAEFMVVSDPENEDGSVTLSYSRLEKEKKVKQLWENLTRLVETGDITHAVIGDPVTKDDNGRVRICGYTAKVEDVNAFIPASELGTNLSADELKGKTMPVKVLKAEQKRRFSNVVLSTKQAALALLPETLSTIEVGSTHTGVVSLIVLASKSNRSEGAARPEIGALVELTGLGVVGFVHKSEFANDRRVKPSDLVKAGDTVEVVVTNVDLEAQRLSLSFKGHTANAEAVAAAESAIADKAQASQREKLSSLSQGMAVSGRVKVILFERDYHGVNGERREMGTIVVLDNGVEAFLHRNECSDSRLVNPSHLFAVGDTIETEVKFVDLEQLRVQLSYKRVAANQPAIQAKQKELQSAFLASLKVGDRRTGTVSRPPEQFGVFVRLGGGIEGLVHVSNIEPDREKQDAALKQYRPGKSVEVEIVKIDVDNGFTRIGLSLVK